MYKVCLRKKGKHLPMHHSMAHASAGGRGEGPGCAWRGGDTGRLDTWGERRLYISTV